MMDAVLLDKLLKSIQCQHGNRNANAAQVSNISLNWFNKCLRGLTNDKLSYPKMTTTVHLSDLKEANKQTKNEILNTSLDYLLCCSFSGTVEGF